jgi:hypothetical protein
MQCLADDSGNMCGIGEGDRNVRDEDEVLRKRGRWRGRSSGGGLINLDGGVDGDGCERRGVERMVLYIVGSPSGAA